MHHCLYCYANYSQTQVIHKHESHHVGSPLIVGNLGDDDIVKERPVKLLTAHGLFDF